MQSEDQLDLGTFEVVSGRLIVTDPCYSEDLWCCNALETVRNGTWNARVAYDGDSSYPHIIFICLIVEHESAESLPAIMEDASFSVGVDSGQAGFFDAGH